MLQGIMGEIEEYVLATCTDTKFYIYMLMKTEYQSKQYKQLLARKENLGARRRDEEVTAPRGNRNRQDSFILCGT
jgi:hypothetical protein